MRPQHITAENVPAAASATEEWVTSMRPQHITAENSVDLVHDVPLQPHFNEAAAYHCGKPCERGQTAAC